MTCGGKCYYVYILTNKFDTLLYVGVTSDLRRRLAEHANGQYQGFTKQYRVHKLIYYEQYSDIHDAISREQPLKGWTLEKKRSLIEKKNPDWDDWGEGFV